MDTKTESKAKNKVVRVTIGDSFLFAYNLFATPLHGTDIGPISAWLNR